ncbi:MAG: hypothetical protein IID45_14725, partial [Planctomycetes bacterium]|nr:hypothetical protein [Planctomycetota bacterium]
MGKFFGFLACTSVVAASIWFTQYGRSDRKIAAGEELFGPQPLSISQLRQEAGAYRRSVGPLYEPETTDDARTARNFMKFAHSAAGRGELATARRLAETAVRLNIRWNADEQTPDDFLRRLDSIHVPRGRSADRADTFGYRYDTAAGRDYRPSARQQTVFRGQSPDDNPFGSSHSNEMTAEELAKLSPAKSQAKELVQQAVALFNQQKYAEARLKALQAKSMKVRWTFFELKPKTVLARIELKTKTTTISAAGPFNSSTVAAPRTDGQLTANSIRAADHRNAERWLSEARKDISIGLLEDAKTKVGKVLRLELTYASVDDTPEKVLDKINQIEFQKKRFAGKKPLFPRTITAMRRPLTRDQQLAKQLLADAKAALRVGNIDEAKRKVAQANALDVTYDLLAENPEDVQVQIDRATGVNTPG